MKAIQYCDLAGARGVRRRARGLVGVCCFPTRNPARSAGRGTSLVPASCLRAGPRKNLEAHGGLAWEVSRVYACCGRNGNLLLVVFLVEDSVLLVLIFGDEIADVLVRLLELHLVHALSLVPVEESLPLVHRAELGGQSLEDALQS